jgi:UDP-glucose 4-epimerase
MKILVTGSSGHLGEALVRTLREQEHDVVALDVLEGPFTTHVGSITHRSCVRHCMTGVEAVLHAATLHKPHVATHGRQDFVDTNITGTLNLLEEAVAAGVASFVYTSTTSVFGDALVPPAGAPAAWITEEVAPVPKNIYGVTKEAGEKLCHLFHRNHHLPCIVLRTSRFFPEEDDDRRVREAYADDNAKANEYLHRRVDIEDVVNAHLLAMRLSPARGFRRYIISATTPFTRDDLRDLRQDAPAVVRRRIPEYEAEYARRGWRMAPSIDRVYVNDRAREELGWRPRYDFRFVIEHLAAGQDFRSPLARLVGSKGYHAGTFAEGPYPVETHRAPSSKLHSRNA